MVVGILNSFYIVFAPLLALIPNFIQIGWKTQKLKIFTIGQFWLVRLVGQKKVVKYGWRWWNFCLFDVVLFGRCRQAKNSRCYFKLVRCFLPDIIFSPHTKFNQNRMKNTEVENFHYWSVLVGRSGWSKNGCSHFKHS